MARFNCFTYHGDHEIKIILKSTQAKWKKLVLGEENWSTLGKTCCSRINSQQIQPSNCVKNRIKSGPFYWDVNNNNNDDNGGDEDDIVNHSGNNNVQAISISLELQFQGYCQFQG